jgi:hypothetical protein
MTEVRTNVKPIAIDIVIRNFIEEIILLTFLIKDQIDLVSLDRFVNYNVDASSSGVIS